MKRTNVELNEQLLSRGKKLTGIKTTKGLLEHALKELIRRRNQKRILELKGKVEWEGDLSQMRKMRIQ
jgi:Arc/MetJ family transcription regulator